MSTSKEMELNAQGQSSSEHGSVAKKSYTSPELAEYGSVRELTKGNSGTNVDGQSLNPKP